MVGELECFAKGTVDRDRPFTAAGEPVRRDVRRRAERPPFGEMTATKGLSMTETITGSSVPLKTGENRLAPLQNSFPTSENTR
jgi:hypothetical protein